MYRRAARCDLLDRQASFEMGPPFSKSWQRIQLRAEKRLHERFILLAIHRRVEIVRPEPFPYRDFQYSFEKSSESAARIGAMAS